MSVARKAIGMRIVSDGTAEGTRVFDMDGKLIEGIASVEISIVPGDLVRARLNINLVELDIVAPKLENPS